MKITKIEVCDFRGFPGPAVYDFEFGKARNLFVYGENGSGKSSLFRAIQEFFNRNRSARPFSTFKNVDSTASDSGHVTVHFDDGSSQVWPHTGARPVSVQPASQTALQVGCLDYRSLLETNFSQKGEQVNIFEVAVRYLIPHYEVAVAGRSQRIGELWAAVGKPRGHYKGYLASCRAAVDRFNAGFEPVISPLIGKASELLAKFPGCNVTLKAFFQPVEYSTVDRDFINRELILQVDRNDALLERHHDFLNEARLSAIALVIYMAGLLISVPTVSAYPKLMVLDDVLVGLDMENRAPVLTILKEFFADWQIILLTHDKVWYEMVQVELEHHGEWKAYELWLRENQQPVHSPRRGGLNFYLDRARRHLDNRDHHAAAIYIRMAFESQIKKYCDQKSIPVPYKNDPKNIKAQSFWEAATKKAFSEAANDAAKTANLKALFKEIDLAKKIVMNPLSHATPTTVTTAEIQAAISAVQNLRFT